MVYARNGTLYMGGGGGGGTKKPVFNVKPPGAGLSTVNVPICFRVPPAGLGMEEMIPPQ
jgi:hypothetical protein